MSPSVSAVAVALFLAISLPDPVSAVKPRPPIELSFSYRHLSEHETHIALIVQANVAGEKVSLRLERPLGLRLIEGEESWEGSMEKGAREKIEILVQSGASPSYEILGKASIHPLKGGIFRQERRLVLDRSKENLLSERPPIKHKGPGGNILEFRE